MFTSNFTRLHLMQTSTCEPSNNLIHWFADEFNNILLTTSKFLVKGINVCIRNKLL